MKLGLIGGTFDPVHKAHLVIAERVYDTCKLDRVLFVPASSPPHKNDVTITPFDHRLRMIELAIADNPQFAASSIESLRPGKSFTTDTLAEMRRLYPNAELYWIIGADSASELHTWHDPARLLKLARFIVVDRPGWSLDNVDPRLRELLMPVEMSMMDVSSTEIRARVRKGRGIRSYVPAEIAEYIETHRLYK